MFFACKVGDKRYQLEKLTLGEARVLRKQFGLEQIEDFNPTDPEQLAGLLYLCMKRENPGLPDALIMAEIDGLDVMEFEAADEEEVPTPAAAPKQGGSGGKRAKSPKMTGAPS